MPKAAEVASLIADQCAGLRVRKASRLITRIYDEAMRDLGVQESQLSVLVAVAKFGERGAAIGELADVLAADRTTMTRNVLPLERAGLIRVARSPSDARVRVATLTPEGERLLESAGRPWQQAQARLRRALGAKAFEALRDSLNEAIDRLQKMED